MSRLKEFLEWMGSGVADFVEECGGELLALALVVGLLALFLVIIASPASVSPERADARARCSSLDGHFSRESLKCFVNGEEV